MRQLMWLVLVLSACGGAQPMARGTTPARPTSAEDFLDADLPSPCSEGRVQLAGGHATYPSTIELDTPGELELTAVGTVDLDGDGSDELIAYVRCMPGGSGTFDSVRAYRVSEGAVVDVAHIEGGDRAAGGLDGARVDEQGNVIVGRFSGEEEGLCCPTHVTDETWRMQGGTFVRVSVGATRASAEE